MALDLATTAGILAVAAFLLILLAAARRRILFRLGFRNVLRRKTQVALAVVGLTVATSIMAGALVIDNSFDATVTALVLRGTDRVDIVLFREDEAGNRVFFDAEAVDRLEGSLSAMAHVEAVAPRIHLPAAAENGRTGLVEPRTNLIGFDPARDLGVFLLLDGSETDGAELAEGEAYVNAKLADALDAEAGDSLRVFANGQGLDLVVRDVVQDRGRGGWQADANLFLRLDALQDDLGVAGRISLVLVSNVGGVADGHLVTDEAVAELEAVLGPNHGFTVDAVKRDRIELFNRLLRQLTQLFLLMSAFTVIAGILLILNIFSGLAEERKTEMGMARALGMRRSHLVQAFIFEGFFYALASSLLGAVAGLGVAWVIMESFRRIFPFFAQDLVVAVRPESLVTAFSLGLLLTLATVALASWRIGRLNIVRAMRDLPEPPAPRVTAAEAGLTLLLVVGGAFALLYGLREASLVAYVAGAPLVALGMAQAAVRRFGPRVPLTLAGLFTLAWGLSPYRLIATSGTQIEAFIVVGVFLVAGGVLLVMANSEVLLKLGTKATRRQRNVPVVKAAIAYPLAKKFRTGVVLAMFALIMFTITVMSMFMALTGSVVGVFAAQESGGYDLIGFASPFAPEADLEARLEAAGLGEAVAYHDGLVLARARVTDARGTEADYALVGVPPSFAERNGFTFHRMADGYGSAAAVWDALRADDGLAVVDRTVQPRDFGPTMALRVDVGDTLSLRNPLGEERTVTVIGILDASFVQGVFLRAEAVEAFAGVSTPRLFYLKAADGVDATLLARDLQRELVDLGFRAVVIDDLVQESMEVTLNVMQLIQAFLALGLAVGIAGLGVLAVRNVLERRSTIGTLRALGFRKAMVLKALLLELSFVAVLGILLGLVLGVALSYNLFLTMSIFQEAEFVVPWANLALILGFAFAASVLATLSPSRRASKLPPAEALRQVL